MTTTGQQWTPPSLLEVALWYASQGLKVHPLKPLRKEPATEHGFQDATTDADQIREWWDGEVHYESGTIRPYFRGNSQRNIGIATGHLVDVIDVDPPRGFRSLAKMLDDDEPENGCVLGAKILGAASTCRPNGLHYYVAATGGGCTTGDPDSGHVNLDFKGLGGYVVAPPSVVERQDADGNYLPGTGVTYQWVRPLNLGVNHG